MAVLLFFALCALLLCAISVRNALKHHRVRRLIHDTPTTEIARLRPGFAEVSGRVVGTGRSLTSPMTGKSCLYYHFEVQQKKRRSSGSSSSSYWKTIVDDRDWAPCAVDDGTGRLEVDLTEADLVLDPDAHARSGFLDEPSESLKQTLAQRYGESTEGIIFNKTLRYEETILEEGDALYALGHATPGDPGRIGRGGPIFIVSDKPESAVAAHYQKRVLGYGALAVGGLAGSIALAAWALSHG